jgi:phytoene synthase
MTTGDLASSYATCVTVARQEARNFYPSFRLLPFDRRNSMCALYGFMRRTDDIADGAGTVEAKRDKLAAWKADFGRALDGEAGEWPGWPALADTVRRHDIPARYLQEVLDGVAMDLDCNTFETFDDLHAYCYRVASAVGLCCLHIWGFRSDRGRAEKLAEACGVALQLTNIVRDVGEDASSGRIYLPREDMERFGVTEADLRAGHTNVRLRRLLEFEGRRAAEYYEQAAPLAELVSPMGRPVLGTIVGVYRALLREIQRRDYDVLAHRVSVPSWRKGAIAAWAMAGRLRPQGRAWREAPTSR